MFPRKSMFSIYLSYEIAVEVYPKNKYSEFDIFGKTFITFTPNMRNKQYEKIRKCVGEVLQLQRKWSLHLNQTEMAQVVDAHQEFISKIESSNKKLDVVDLIDYCDALQLSFPEFAASVERRLWAERLITRRNKTVDDSIPKDEVYKCKDVRSLLNACTPYVSLTVISRASGISQSLLSQYANGLKKASLPQMQRIVDTIHDIGKELMAVTI